MSWNVENWFYKTEFVKSELVHEPKSVHRTKKYSLVKFLKSITNLVLFDQTLFLVQLISIWFLCWATWPIIGHCLLHFFYQ